VGRRGEVSADALAAWKRTRAKVAQEQVAGTRRLRAARYEASEADARQAIDVGEEIPVDARQKLVKPKRAEMPSAPTDARDEGGETTSRLLRAKRRARGEDDGGDEERRDG